MHHRWQALSIRTFLVPVALASGCSDGIGPEGDFVLTGRWASAPWVGSAEALLVGGAPIDTLYVFGTRASDAEVPEEVIRVRVPFTGLGSYALDHDAVAFTVLIGGDVVSAEYNGHSPTAGALEVDEYDATAGLISGTIAFDAEAVTDFRPYGASARFASGQFRARVRRSNEWLRAIEHWRPNPRIQRTGRKGPELRLGAFPR